MYLGMTRKHIKPEMYFLKMKKYTTALLIPYLIDVPEACGMMDII